MARRYARYVDELLDRIAAGPADQEIELLRVYADQLILSGDPFGELIVVSTARLAAATPELVRREDALIAERNAELGKDLDRPTSTTYRWRRGFLDAIELSHHGDEALEAVIPKLAARREARLLRRIEIDSVEFDGQGNLAPVFAALAKHAAVFPRLTEIVIREGMNLGNPWIDGPIALGDVTPLYAAYPGLEVLELGGDRLELGDIVLPSVRRLLATSLRVEDARRFIVASVPRLADLELGFRYGQPPNFRAVFGPLLHRDFGPQLEALSLALPSSEAQTWMVAELPAAPIARHVRRLAFRHSKLDEGSLLRLMADAKRYRHLERLELYARPLSASFQKNLRKTFGDVLALV